MAYFLLPNIFAFESFGKFLFVAFDLICGYLIIKINNLENVNNQKNVASLCFWLYNPITLAIASRGNAESIMSFFVLVFIFFFKKEYYVYSGIVYAISIHFKIYPITYGLAIFLAIIRFQPSKNIKQFLKSIFYNKNLILFGASFAFTIGTLTFLFYLKF